MKAKAQIVFWLITLGTVIALILSRLVQDGMFTDGVLYASVAHNLAIGKGTIWFPYFDNFMFPFFHQQPPLTFAIQSLFYQKFGDSIYVERGYSFLTACLSAILIILIWRKINKDNIEFRRTAWLPVLLWIIIPVCFWAYCNNMEENTMGVFTLLSVWLMYSGLTNEGWRKTLLVIAGSIITVFASMCKGFPGLFPIAIPAIYFFVVKPVRTVPSRAIFLSIVAIIIPFVIYYVLMFHNYIHRSLLAYLNDRVLNSIENVSNVNSRFYLIGELFGVQLIVPAVLVVIILLMSGKEAFRFKDIPAERKKKIMLFFLIGVIASFPLIVTKEQRGFYLVTSLPYYAIALALMAVPHVCKLGARINVRSNIFNMVMFAAFLYVVLGLFYSYKMVGKTGRDKEQLHDVYAFGKIIHNDADIRVYPETWKEWGLHNYFVRYFNISLALDTSTQYNYFLLEKSLNKMPPPVYSKLVATGEKYDLYTKQ